VQAFFFPGPHFHDVPARETLRLLYTGEEILEPVVPIWPFDDEESSNPPEDQQLPIMAGAALWDAPTVPKAAVIDSPKRDGGRLRFGFNMPGRFSASLDARRGLPKQSGLGP